MRKPNSMQIGKSLRLLKVKGAETRQYRLYRGDRLLAEIEDVQVDMIDSEGHTHTAGAVMDINSNTIVTTIEPHIAGRNKRKQEAAFESAPLKLAPLNGDPSKGVIITKAGCPVCTIRIENIFTAYIYCSHAQGFLE